MLYLITDGAFLTVSTLIGAFFGLFFTDKKHGISDMILAVSAGIMLFASFSSLILPRINTRGNIKFAAYIIIMLLGTVLTSLIQSAPGFIRNMAKSDGSKKLEKVLVFVTVIAVHKIPEGLAAGLSCAAYGNSAFSLSLGLAIQNIPDGLIVSAPLTAYGVSKPRAFAIAASTSLFSLLGMFAGYFGVKVAKFIIDYALSFAGGMMIFVTFSLFEQMKVNKYTSIAVSLGIVIMMLLERFI